MTIVFADCVILGECTGFQTGNSIAYLEGFYFAANLNDISNPFMADGIRICAEVFGCAFPVIQFPVAESAICKEISSFL